MSLLALRLKYGYIIISPEVILHILLSPVEDSLMNNEREVTLKEAALT
jgi:hypothetical protein